MEEALSVNYIVVVLERKEHVGLRFSGLGETWLGVNITYGELSQSSIQRNALQLRSSQAGGGHTPVLCIRQAYRRGLQGDGSKLHVLAAPCQDLS